MKQPIIQRLVILCSFLLILASCSEEVEMPATGNSVLSRSAISESADSTIETYGYFYDQKMPVVIDASKKYVIRRKSNFSVASVPYAATVTEEYEGEIVDVSELTSNSVYSTHANGNTDIVAIEDVTDEGVPLHQFMFVGLKRKSDMNILEKLASEIGCKVLGTIPGNDMIVKLSTGLGSELTSLPASVYLYEHGDFKFVDPGFKLTYKTCTTDPWYSEQWGLNGSCGINVERAWLTTKGSPDITIAIIDHGINSNLAEFNTHMHSYSITNGFPSDDHGTFVASVAGASHNGIGVAGVAPLAKLMDINYTLFTGTSLYQCIENAYLNGADVINCSWGYEKKQGWDAVLVESVHKAIKEGRNGKGCVVVFAAGNNGTINFPARNTTGTIIVGATNSYGKLWSSGRLSSGKGEQLTVVAPGEDIVMMKSSGERGQDSGTSYAAPHVAGLAALILSVRPELTSEQVKNIIIETASGTTHSNDYGWGRINAGRAVDVAAQNYSLTVHNNPVTPTNGLLTYYLSGTTPSASVVWSSRSGARLLTSNYQSATFEYPMTTGNISETITATVTHYGKTKSVSFNTPIGLSANINSISKLQEYDQGGNSVHLFADCTHSNAQLVWEIVRSSGCTFDLQEFTYAGDAPFIGRESHYATLVCGGSPNSGTYCTIRVWVNETGGGDRYCTVRGYNGQWIVEDSQYASLSLDEEEEE